MLSTFELVINVFLVVFLFPIVIWSLLRGSPTPAGTLAKYYEAEPYLNLTGNVMLVVLCCSSIARLARHFGYIGADLATLLGGWIGVPLAVLVLAFLVLWIRAILKVRRGAAGA